MVNWYKNLYVGDTAKKKQKKWMRRIENKKAVPGVWLLTLPSKQQNNLSDDCRTCRVARGSF